MTVRLYAFTCGYLTLPRGLMLKGESGFMTVPVPSYLVVHPKGRALFDTGLHENLSTDPVAHLGERVASAFQFHLNDDDRIDARLATVDVAADRIDFVINSHLHYDHCGGNRQLSNAEIVLQQRELAHARDVKNEQGYTLADWDTGQPVRAIDGEHDLFGDGSVVCFPTYGPHTRSSIVARAHGEGRRARVVRRRVLPEGIAGAHAHTGRRFRPRSDARRVPAFSRDAIPRHPDHVRTRPRLLEIGAAGTRASRMNEQPR